MIARPNWWRIQRLHASMQSYRTFIGFRQRMSALRQDQTLNSARLSLSALMTTLCASCSNFVWNFLAK